MLNWWHVTCLHPEESACNFFLHSKCQVIQASFPVHRSGKVCLALTSGKMLSEMGLLGMIALRLIHTLAYTARIPLYCIRSPTLRTGVYDTSLLEFCQCLGSC